MRRLALILLTLLGFAGIVHAQTVTIDFSSTLGSANHRASGVFYGMGGTVPADNLLVPLKLGEVRNDFSYVFGLSQYDAGLYPRVVANGGHPILVLGDVWIGEGNPSYVDSSSMSAWTSFVAGIVNNAIAHGQTFEYDVWNEPDLNISPGWEGTEAQFQAMWAATVNTIRGIDPSQVIMGPSACCSISWMTDTLTFAKANSVLPNIVAFHEFGGPGATASDIASVKSFLSANDPGLTLIAIPEMVSSSEDYLPGTNVQYLAAIERAQIQGAGHAFWSGADFNNYNLDGMLIGTSTTPRAIWYVYQGYGAIGGNIIAVTAASGVDGVAGFDSGACQSNSLFGVTGGETVTFNYANISSAASCLIVGGKVHAKLFSLADDGGSGSSGPTLVSEADYTVSGDAIGPSIAMGANGAAIIQLTPPSGGGGGGGGGAGPNTYYADYSSGSDSNNGTSKSTPWQNAPGMVNATGNPAAHSPIPGDNYILKGGVSWPASDFPMFLIYTGISSSTTPVGCAGPGCIYIGTDPTWYSGGSFTRPAFDGQGTEVVTRAGSSQTVVDLYGGYFVLDNIEFKNWWQLDGPESGPLIKYVDLRGLHEEAKNNYFHAWGHGGSAVGDNSQIFGGGANCPPDMTSSIHDNVADGSDTTGDMLMFAHPGVGYIYNNYLSNIHNGVLGSAIYVFGNTFLHINGSFDSYPACGYLGCGSHGNVVESTGCQLIIYNNYSSDANGGASIFHTPVDGLVDYDFNNVFTAQQNQTIQIDGDGLSTGSGSGIYVFNDTLQSPPGTPFPLIDGPTRGGILPFMNVYNNDLIGDNPTWTFATNVATPSQSNNVGQTNAQAAASGYSSSPPYPFLSFIGSPTSSSGLSNTAMAPICSGIPSTSTAPASTACQSDTPVGVGYNSSNHTVIAPNRTSVGRPSGSWDSSAYQAGGTPLPRTSYSVAPIDFGSVTIGSTPTLALVLQNTGGAALTISSITVTGTGFSGGATTCGSTLAVSATCSVTLDFSPASAISYSGSITFVTNGPSSPDAVALLGSGTAAGAAATPAFTPAAGAYALTQSVSISDSTTGATIYYTTDGSTPTTGSTVYTTPITVSMTTTVKAIASATGFTNSSVGSAVYTIAGSGSGPCELTRSLTVDHTKVGSSDSTNFPVLLSGTYTYLKTIANGGEVHNSSGYDIEFSSDSAGLTLLKWEVESYDPTTGIINVWVQVPAVSHTVDTVIYLHYGDTTISTFQGGSVGSVWDSSFQGVYHLGSLTADSTSNANTGTLSSPAPTATTGQIDGAASFVEASSEYVSTGAALSPLSTGFTYSAWVKATSFPNSYNSVFTRDGGGNYTAFQIKSSGKLFLYTDVASYDGSGSNTLAAGSWYHVVMTYDSTAGLVGYVNGASDGTAAAGGTLNTTSRPSGIGQDPANGRYWDGLIDEVRVSNAARSADWIKAEYNNQSSPSTFYSLGAESGGSCGGGTTISPKITQKSILQ
jgi:hypothetical protein